VLTTSRVAAIILPQGVEIMSKSELLRSSISRRGIMKAGVAAGAAAMLGRNAKQTVGGDPPPSPFSHEPFTRDLPAPPILEPCAPFTPGDCYHGCAPEYYDGVGPNYDGTHPAHWNMPSMQYYEMHVQESMSQILPGIDTPIFGYNGIAPGPTLRGKVGQPMMIRYTNDMPVEVSTHNHGGHLPAHSDGFPNFYVLPGKSRDYFYPMTVPLEHGKPDWTEAQSTMWYHDHTMDITGHNVVKGLAGFFIASGDFEDDKIASNVLPEIDGEFDIPMVFQDQRLNADGSIFYDFLDHNGRVGDIWVVNGVAQPKLHVKRRKYRFRFLVGSTARIHNFQMSWGHFLQIANDSWLMRRALNRKRILRGMSQRCDVIVDFSDAPEEVILYNVMDQDDGRGPTGKILPLDEAMPLVKFIVEGPRESGDCTIAKYDRLLPTRPIHDDEIVTTRKFTFERGNGAWKINDMFFNPERADACPRLDSAEHWILENKSGGWWHPIHIHMESHQVVKYNGGPPPKNLRSKSDASLLTDNGVVELRMKFRTFTGPFVMHCHNLEHEDMRMMTTFDPRPEGTSRPMGPDGRPKIPSDVSGMPVEAHDLWADVVTDHDRLTDGDGTVRDSEIIGETTTP